MEGGRHKPRRMGRVARSGDSRFAKRQWVASRSVLVTLPLAPVLYSIFVLDLKVQPS